MAEQYYPLETGQVLVLQANTMFPPLTQALETPNGLIAIGGNLEPTRLLSAYRQGIFPWYGPEEPILWWSPDPRMVLFPDEIKISKSLAKTLKSHRFENRINTAFQAVISGCASSPRAGQSGTWISEEIMAAYCELHRLGYAISSESWINNELVGGCYGVKIGRMFYGESMFHTVSDASKIAFVHLVEHLKNQGVGMIDCQMKTPLLSSFGGREIARKEFAQRLANLIN